MQYSNLKLVSHHRTLRPTFYCSAKSLSKYTDAVDGVSRDARDRLAAATDTARTRLKVRSKVSGLSEELIPIKYDARDRLAAATDTSCTRLNEVQSQWHIRGTESYLNMLLGIG